MTLIFLQLAAAIIAVAGAQQQNQNFDDDKMVACGMELIWPPSDAIVLMALDSRSVMVYPVPQAVGELFCVFEPHALATEYSSDN